MAPTNFLSNAAGVQIWKLLKSDTRNISLPMNVEPTTIDEAIILQYIYNKTKI